MGLAKTMGMACGSFNVIIMPMVGDNPYLM